MDLDFREKSRAGLFASLWLALLIIVSPALPKDRTPFKPTLSLKLTGGWGSALPKDDIDIQMESVNTTATLEYWRLVDPSRVIGEIRALNNHLPEWEAELRASFGPHFSLGFATSIPHKKTIESSLRYIMVPGEEGQIIDMMFRPTIKVGPPIKFSLHYSPFRESGLNISINGGIGLYPAEIKEDFVHRVTIPSGNYGITERYISAATRFPLGFQAGLCFRYRVARNIAFVIESEWRYVNLSDFRGRARVFVNEYTADGELWHSVQWEQGGTLYFYTEEDLYLGSRYADLQIWDKVPNVSIGFLRDIRKVRLDLTRYALRIGIEIRLF